MKDIDDPEFTCMIAAELKMDKQDLPGTSEASTFGWKNFHKFPHLNVSSEFFITERHHRDIVSALDFSILSLLSGRLPIPPTF